MNYELFSGLAVFALVASITPGPNNLMLMASGANFGFRRTIPHSLGVAIGFTVMTLLVGSGLSQVFIQYPASYTVLKVVSVAYLLYLAWKIGTAAPPSAETEVSGKPFTFFQAALFQWVNPKAWTMTLTAISIYAPDQSLKSVALVSFVFGVINLPCICTWILLGQKLRVLLTDPKQLRIFNITMASLLVLSLYPVLNVGTFS